MALARLEVRDFRCFSAVDLDFAPRTNLVVGENASGKTSLLEAIFVLSHGRSFRTSDTEILPREGQGGFSLFGRIEDTTGRTTAVGMGRKGRVVELRVAGAPARSLAELAAALPVQIIDAEAHRLIEDGPKYRRRYLDWGLFHVEPRFLEAWRRYQRALKQRNEALKQRQARRAVLAWDEELVVAGDFLDGLRRAYLSQLSPVADTAVRVGLDLALALDYRPGWAAGQTFREALDQAWPRDQAAGQTHVGPHRAELVIRVEGRVAEDRVSRGQQKLLASALIVAQLRLVFEASGRGCVLLVDDLPAELDTGNIGRLLGLLEDLPGQRLVTAISVDKLPQQMQQDARAFHVERGRVIPL